MSGIAISLFRGSCLTNDDISLVSSRVTLLSVEYVVYVYV